MKKILSYLLILAMCVSLLSPTTLTVSAAENAQRASNIVIAGVDIGYAAGQYFSTTGSQCNCHGRGTCGEASDCTCKIVSGCCQCFGFALWCQNKMFGKNDVSNPGSFHNIGSLSAGSMSAANVKNLIYGKAAPGSHIRTSGSAHSMVIMSIDANGMRIAQANGSNNSEYTGYYRCRIGTYYYTWASYASSTYGKRGIAYVKVPNDAPISGGGDTHTPNSTYSGYLPFKAYTLNTGKITVYNANGTAYDINSRYIDGTNDLCTITAVYTDGWCKVQYPSSSSPGGYFEAYVPLSAFIPSASPVAWTASKGYEAYKRSNMSSSIGSVSSGDRCLRVSTSGTKYQVIYPVTGAGYYKMGWIETYTPSVNTNYPTPIRTYAASTGKVTVYDGVNGNAYALNSHYIDGAADVCTLNEIYSSGWCKVTYPTSSGTFTAYTPMSSFIPSGSAVSIYHTGVTSRTNVYTNSGMGTSFGNGYVDPGDDMIVVGKSGDKYQVIYPITTGTYAGQWKMGWINGTYLKKNLTGISITTKPSKTIYLEGENFSSAGMVVTATYDNGTSSAITGYKVEGYTSTPGAKTITISYTYDGVTKTTSLDVTVNAKSVTGIAVTTQPQKTSYYIGDDFNSTGMLIKATYNNGTSAIITDYEIQDYDFSNAGAQKVEIGYVYNSKIVTTTVSVNVIAPTIQLANTSLELKKEQTSSLNAITTPVNQSVTYQSSNEAVVTVNSNGIITAVGAGSAKITAQFTYNGYVYTKECAVTVAQVSLQSISIINKPSKLTYNVGDILDTNGLELKASYEDGSTKTITSGFVCTPTNLNTVGTQTITVSYGGKNVQFTVNVKDPQEEAKGIISIKSANAVPGGEVKVAINMEKNPGIIAACLKVAYDKNVLTLTKVEDGGILGSYLFGKTLTANPYTLLWENGLATQNYTSTGTLAILTFKVAENAPEASTNISLSCAADDIFNVDMNNVPFTLKSGTITVSNACTILEQPKSASVKVGEVATFEVKAAGTGLTYQWYSCKPGGSWSIMSGNTSSTLSVSAFASRNGYKYRCEITDSKGNKLVSGEAVLTIRSEENSFTDVPESAWYYNSVMKACQSGIMGGLTETTFGPDKTLTRAQFATILYQLGGKPAIEYSAKFSDIPKGQWYTDGVLWANSIGVVGGYNNGTFGPNNNITREQMALMMYNYAKYKGYDISKTADISSYEDVSKVSSYAKEAFKWAVGNQIIGGKAGNKLDPQGNATRAECAVIMTQFMEKNIK